MRNELAGYEGKVRRFYATYACYTERKNYKQTGVGRRYIGLLKNVSLQDGMYLADHLWADWDSVGRVPFKEGTEIKFLGCVKSYRKYINNKVVYDYSITDISHVEEVKQETENRRFLDKNGKIRKLPSKEKLHA